MEQEVNYKVTCIAVKTSEDAGRAFVRALSGFVSKQKKYLENIGKDQKGLSDEKLVGKAVKIKDLRKDGSQIESIDMGIDEMKGFRKYARKYNVAYHMEKNKSTDPPTYFIYFKAKDATLTNNAIKDYIADKLKINELGKESIREKLIKAKEKAGAQVSKVRNKEKVR